MFDKYKMKLVGISCVALLGVSLVSCSEDTMDKINEDKNHAQNVQAKFIVTDLITASAFSITGGDLSTYASVYIEHEAGIHNQMYNAEMRVGEPKASSTYNNSWGALYSTLKDAKKVVSKCSEGGEESYNSITRGVGRFFIAYNLTILTDLFGDTPWSEACDFQVSMQPKLDKQSEIYSELITMIDAAIEDLSGTDKMPLGKNDLIYGGDAAKWTKACYALKARVLMHGLYRASDQNAVLNQIIACVGKSFANPTEELKFNHYDGVQNLNPYFAFGWSRDALAASQSLVDKFTQLKDPRLTQVFMTPKWMQITDPKEINAAPNGEVVQQQFVYSTSFVYGAGCAPTQMLSYHELMFLKAEALARLNKNDDAKAALYDAMVAGFANLETACLSVFNTPVMAGVEGKFDLSAKVLDPYFNGEVISRFTANPLKEIMIQKYLAFYGASGEAVEAYADYRRLAALGDGDFIKLANKKPFPQRYPYGSSDVVANLNVKEAYGDGEYVYTEKVWWAGGDR